VFAIKLGGDVDVKVNFFVCFRWGRPAGCREALEIFGDLKRPKKDTGCQLLVREIAPKNLALYGFLSDTAMESVL